MDRSSLYEVRKDTKDRIDKMTMTKTDPGRSEERDNLIIAYEKDISDIDEALAALAKKETKVEVSNDTNITLDFNRISNSVQNRITELGPFRPDTGLINNFILKLDNLYNLLVKENVTTHTGLERNFVTMVILTLPTSAQTKFQSEKTWSSLKDKLKAFYQQDISIFQHLAKLWDFSPGSNNWAEIATQMTAMVSETKHTITQKFASNSETLTASHCFDLIGAMLMSELVRNQSPETYRMMIEKLDQCRTATDVAIKANFYKDRLSEDHLSSYKITSERRSFKQKIQAMQDKADSRTKPKRNYGDQTKEEKDLIKQCVKEKVCIRFNLGQKCKTDPCYFEHRKLDQSEPKTALLTQVADWKEDLFPEGN